MSEVKFQKYAVVGNGLKARVFYSLDNRTDGRKCVTIYAKDYDRALGKIISAGYINETDSMTDYFEQGRVVLFEDSPLYAAARVRAEAEEAIKQVARDAYDAKLAARRAAY